MAAKNLSYPSFRLPLPPTLFSSGSDSDMTEQSYTAQLPINQVLVGDCRTRAAYVKMSIERLESTPEPEKE